MAGFCSAFGSGTATESSCNSCRASGAIYNVSASVKRRHGFQRLPTHLLTIDDVCNDTNDTTNRVARSIAAAAAALTLVRFSIWSKLKSQVEHGRIQKE
jgi:hypothetical protein